MQGLPLFRSALAQEWLQFRQSTTSHVHQPGDTLFYQGNRPLGLHFLCSGRVKLLKESSAGRSQIVRTVQAPDLLGDRAFFAETVYACTATVMEPAKICFLEARIFWSLFGRNTAMLRLLAQRFARELGHAEAYMNCIAGCTVLERTANYLSTYKADSGGCRATGEEFDLSESRTELAQLLATTPEAVSRAFAELCSKGLIAVQGRHVRILKGEHLRASACMCDSDEPGDESLAVYQAVP